MLVATGVWSESWAQGGTASTSKAVNAEFSFLPSGASIPSTYQTAGITFFAHQSPYYSPIIVDHGGERGYGFPDTGVTVVLPIEVRSVEVRVCLFASNIMIEALNSAGTLISQQSVQLRNQCGDVVLKGDQIAAVRFTGGSREASIVRLSAKACDPSLVCLQQMTCIYGQLYPTACGPNNCDEPIRACGEGSGGEKQAK